MTSAPSACTANMRHERTAVAVDQHRAGAAHAVLAPEVRAGEPAVLAEEVGERLARLRRGRVRRWPLTVNVMAMLSHGVLSSAARSRRALHEVRADATGGTRRTRARRPVGSASATASRAISARSARLGDAPSSCGLGGAGPHRVWAPCRTGRWPQRSTASVVVELDRGDGAGEGEVAVAAGDLLDREAAPARPHREVHAR